MAFRNHLVSATHAQVEALRGNQIAIITPSLALSVSHLIAYWVETQPLGQLLGQAIDGGEILNSSLRHQLRDPCFHDPQTVRSLYTTLSEAWQQVTASQPVPPDDWYRIEIEKVLRLFAHAAGCGECVVSALEPCDAIHFHTTP
ncbi:MAG: hypothetical protein K8U57_06185 [Planctomycetes bacterium]|nr:hypothetical protein [Planctomycetota bacterium]